MTTENTTTEATEVEPTSNEEPTTENGTEEEENTTGNEEAARYRRRLRETEAERDGLTTRLEALQRAEIERIAGAKLTVPAGLWAAPGANLAAMLDDEGNVDAAKVFDAVAAARAEIGLEPNRLMGNYVPNEGMAPSTGGGGGFADSLA